MKSKFEKWIEWFDTIFNEIANMLDNRYIFKELRNMVTNNPNLPEHNIFYKYLSRTYINSALMTIRRQTDFHKDSVSLLNLLNEICKSPEEFSRTRFVNMFNKDGGGKRYADRYFDKFSFKDSNNVDPSLIARDICELKNRANKCKEYTDKRIAHYDIREIKNPLFLNDIDNCIDLLEELIKKYYFLFKVGEIDPIITVTLNDLKAIFKIPWLTKK